MKNIYLFEKILSLSSVHHRLIRFVFVEESFHSFNKTYKKGKNDFMVTNFKSVYRRKSVLEFKMRITRRIED